MSAKYPYTDFHELNDDILIARVQNLKEHVKEQDVRIDDLIHNIPDVDDYYNKTEVDNLLDDKADKSDTYTKNDVDDLLDDKADKSDTYTKTEVDGLLDDKADTADLATVAFTGDYDDLIDKPVIPDISNYYNKTETDTLLSGKENSLGTGEIGEVLTQVSANLKSWVEPHYMPAGGTSGQVLTKASNANYAAIWDDVPEGVPAHTSSDSGKVLSVDNNGDMQWVPPQSYSQQQSNWTENDSTSVTYIQNKPTLATVATSGSYNDLSDKPTIPAAQVNSNWNATSGVAQILNKPTLATVATSGSYADLSNKPTIPTVNNATLTIQKNGSNVATFTANASSNATANITCENKISWTTSGYWRYWKDSANVYHMCYTRELTNVGMTSALGNLYYRSSVYTVNFPISLSGVYSIQATVQDSSGLTGVTIQNYSASAVGLWLWSGNSGTRTIRLHINVIST